MPHPSRIRPLPNLKRGLQVFLYGRDEYLLKLARYRTKVKDGNHEKITKKIKKIISNNGKEVYIERKFKEINTDNDESLEDLLLKEETVLVKGLAGDGKISIAAKTFQKWAKGNCIKNII